MIVKVNVPEASQPRIKDLNVGETCMVTGYGDWIFMRVKRLNTVTHGSRSPLVCINTAEVVIVNDDAVIIPIPTRLENA